MRSTFVPNSHSFDIDHEMGRLSEIPLFPLTSPAASSSQFEGAVHFWVILWASVLYFVRKYEVD